MYDYELERELKGLRGDLNMTKMAVSSVQNEMAEQLSGEMGEDMNAVLNGERFVTISVSMKVKHKIKTWIRRFFTMF